MSEAKNSMWSDEAEQSVLGGLLIDIGAFDKAHPLTDAMFYRPEHAAIWRAIVAEHAAGHAVDVITVAERLGAVALDAVGGLVYLNSLAQSVPSARHVGAYARIIRERAVRRDMLAAARELVELAEGDSSNAETLDAMSARFAGLHVAQVKKAPRRLADIALMRTAHYEALQAGQVSPGTPTHIPTLDDALNGGLKGGKLIFIGARPAVGKTSLSMQILIEQAKAGRPGLFLSQEMAGEEVADRAVSSLGRIDYGALQRGTMSADDWSRAAEMLDAAHDLPLWIDDQGSLTLEDIKHKVRSVPGVKVVVLDYLQLCAGAAKSKSDNRNGEIEEISRGLKALTLELDLTIIALSQLNRKVEERPNKRPQLSDLRDSGSIEQDADVIIFLWPVRDLDGGAKLVGLGVDKNRQGRTAEMALHFTGAQQRWAESTESLYKKADNEVPRRRGVGG